MRSYTKTCYEGERIGDIDWGYDFRSHFNLMCSNDARKDEACEKSKKRLKLIEDEFRAGREIRTTTYGGGPRCGMHRVIDVGMYDGWPYWKPTPSVMVSGVLGAEWHSFSSLTDVWQPSAASVSEP
jgi:hypothetical protein